MTIEGDYMNWLRSKVEPISETRPWLTHSLLCEQLFNTQFVWRVDFDGNRAVDGTSLRDDFCDEVGSWGETRFIFEPCSVLEMLIALCIRLAFETDEGTHEDGVTLWFWILMENLELDGFTDDDYDSRKVARIVFKFLHRNYYSSGKGGLFPLTHTTTDQLETEVWYQMASYLNDPYTKKPNIA